MLTMDFAKNRALIEDAFKEPRWQPHTGPEPAELEAMLARIAQGRATRPMPLVKAEMVACVLDNARLDVRPCDRFADQFRHDWLIPRIEAQWIREAKDAPGLFDPRDAEAIACRAFTGNEDFGHTCPDWEALLSLGYPGILARARGALAAADTRQKHDFLTACVQSVEALLRFVLRLADEAARQGMAEVAHNLRALAQGPPRTLHEALQLSMITYWTQTCVDNANVRSLGAFDRLYQPFYEADLAAGRSRESLAELLRYYFCRINAADITANMPFSLCGVDRDESEVSSDFTRLVLEVYGELGLISPKIHIRTHETTPPDILRKVFSLIRGGISSFVFCNDDVVIDSLVKLGETPRDARQYIMVGCYESTSMGKEVACSCNGRISLPKAVEYALTGGIDLLRGERVGAATSTQPESFDDFLAAVGVQLDDLSARCMGRIAAIERLYPAVHASPLFSATMQACLDKGMDAHEGGAVYNFSSINLLGLGSAADALVAVKRLVYDERRLTLRQLAGILRDDWAGHEPLRLLCKRRYPKYGNNNAEADGLAAILIRTAAGAINGKPNSRGGAFRAGAFSIDWRFDFGAHTGASADGRRAGETLSKNIGASVGMDREGITALALSAARIDYTALANGTVLDLVWHETATRGEDGMRAMLAVLKTLFVQGVIAMQCNVLNADTLRSAQREPEKYANLQVRLCGWNVLFVNLSRKEQDEFIAQSEAG